MKLPDLDAVKTDLESLERTSDRGGAARLAEEVVVEDVWVAVLVLIETFGDAGRAKRVSRDDRGLEVEERSWDLDLEIGTIGLLADTEGAIVS